MIMVKKDNSSQMIEQGDIFFFIYQNRYWRSARYKDVQRFYMVTAVEGANGRDKNKDKDM